MKAISAGARRPETKVKIASTRNARCRSCARPGPTRSGAACPRPGASARREAGQRDDEEQDDDDGEGDGVDVAHLATSPSAPAGPSAPGPGTPGRSLRCSVMTIYNTTPSTGMEISR